MDTRCWVVVGGLLLVWTVAPARAQVSFVDRASEAGVENLSFGRGNAMIDLDGDGLLDLIAANSGTANDFFRQAPDHTFERVNDSWGIAPDARASWGVVATDFDNDGDVDVYFMSGGFDSIEDNQLLRNDLDSLGVFTDVTAEAGDAAVGKASFGATALDYDRDGDLDLFVSILSWEPSVLLRNDGGLVFTDVSAEAGITDYRASLHCSAGDFDNDGWIDIAVGSHRDGNLLYRNNGDGTFTEVAEQAGVASPRSNFGLVLEDFDNDGWMDIYVPKYQPVPTGPSELYRNDGDGTFTNVTAGSGITGQSDMGHNTGDVDADGYPDIYIGTGAPSLVDEDVLFLITPDGSGGLSASNYSVPSGVDGGGPTRTHGIAIGDYDGDGFVDLFVNRGGPQSLPGTLGGTFLWKSQGNAHRWTALSLRGVISNRSAVGARSTAYTSAGREVHRTLRAGSGFANTDSPIQHFGIGSDERVERIEIRWPSGIVQTVNAPPMEQVTEVVECANCGADDDGDGVPNGQDVCPARPNGPEAGSCLAGDEVGGPCTGDAACGAGGLCSLAQEDADGDGIGDVCDACVCVRNADQRDTNGDGIGNACDPDYNGDGVVGMPDLAQFVAILGTDATHPAFDADMDANGDDVIGYPDLALVSALLGGAPGSSGLAPNGPLLCGTP